MQFVSLTFPPVIAAAMMPALARIAFSIALILLVDVELAVGFVDVDSPKAGLTSRRPAKIFCRVVLEIFVARRLPSQAPRIVNVSACFEPRSVTRTLVPMLTTSVRGLT